MPGVIKQHKQRKFGRTFPHSQYNDARGGRASALERNVLRYRAIETVLYLYFAEDLREFIINTALPDADANALGAWASGKSQQVARLLSRLVSDARRDKKLTSEEATQLRALLDEGGRQSKKLKAAFRHAINVGLLTPTEANEVAELIDYRNDVAHRIHLVMADISRSHYASAYIDYAGAAYKTDALDRLRRYRKELPDRQRTRWVHSVSFDFILFDLAESVFEEELKRLERLIERQLKRANAAHAALSAELDLSGTELVGDLSPRFPPNHYPERYYGDDLIASCKRLTKRGAEICYRLYDIGKSPLAVAYLMGMSLAATKRRKQSWLKAGGTARVRADIVRYDLKTGRKQLTAAAGDAEAGAPP